MLWRNVRRGSRATQVLGSPRMPHAKVGHLPAIQGVESVPTGMAPPRRGCSGWMSTRAQEPVSLPWSLRGLTLATSSTSACGGTTPSPDTSRPPVVSILLIVIVLLVLSSATGAFVLLQRRGVPQVIGTATMQAQPKTTTQANSTPTTQVQATASLTVTATALQNIYLQATSGTPVLSDPLSHQDRYNWDESANCTFVGGTITPVGYSQTTRLLARRMLC